MSAPFYIAPGGPVIQGGNPVLITRAEFEACCCGYGYWCRADTVGTPEDGACVTDNEFFCVGPSFAPEEYCDEHPETGFWFGSRNVSGPYETESECQAECGVEEEL